MGETKDNSLTTAPQPQDLGAEISSLKRTLSEMEKKYNALLLTTPDVKARYDAARVAYSEYGNQIRHFSTTRSALTTFLVTVGMTAFATFLDKKFPFLFWAGIVFAISSACVCLWFSYQTERHVIRYKDMWNLLNGKQSVAQIGDLSFEEGQGRSEVAARMWKDPMNWLLLAAVAVFLLSAFWLRCYLHY